MSEAAWPRTRESPGDGRLLLRFALGTVALGRQRLIATLRSVQPGSGDQHASPVSRRVAYQVIGALSEAPGAVTAARRTLRALGARTAGRLASMPLHRRLDSRPIRWAADRVETARWRARGQLERWEKVGRDEAEAARDLADPVIERVFEDAFAVVIQRLASHPDLQALIAEQSAGLTRGAIDELRARGARADDRLDTLARRLHLRRPRRPSSPSPAAPGG
jgi:hypothetical protein